MATRATSRKAGSKARSRPTPGPPDDYLALVRAFPLVPIRDDAHHAAAIEQVNRLVDIPELTPGQRDYLLALGLLIRCHESDLYGEPEAPGPAEALAGLIEAREISQAELSRATGVSTATISEVLSGRREPSKRAIRAFADYFGVDAGFFL